MNFQIFGDVTGRVGLDDLPLSDVGFFPSALAPYLGGLSGIEAIDSDKDMSQRCCQVKILTRLQA
jgi:hypothetical protein